MTDVATALLTRRGALRRRLGLMGPVEALRARTEADAMADNAAEVATVTEVLASHEHAMAELRAVEVALAMIERQEYGACESCGEAIAKARLQAIELNADYAALAMKRLRQEMLPL